MAEGMLQRAMRVLTAFDEDAPVLTAAALVARTGLPTSTVHRLLAQLVGEGLLDRSGAHGYTPGARLWEIGELSPVAVRLRETALPHMLRLYEATGENVHLAVLDAPTPRTASLVFAGRLTGRASVPTLGREGGRHPLHATGVGKALLATRDAEWLDEYLAVPLLPETTLSITDPEALRAEIATVAVRGYATARGEMTLGNVSVAAALGVVSGLSRAAIGVVAHRDDVRLAPLVMQAAKDLTRALRDDRAARGHQ